MLLLLLSESASQKPQYHGHGCGGKAEKEKTKQLRRHRTHPLVAERLLEQERFGLRAPLSELGRVKRHVLHRTRTVG